MNGELPGFRKTVGPTVGMLVRLAVRPIPAPLRDRYDAEFRAELVSLPPGRRTGQAISLLIGSPALRRALRDPADAPISTGAQRNWRCRIGRHRDFPVQDDNPENRRSRHLECTRCLRVKDTKDYEHPTGNWIANGGPF